MKFVFTFILVFLSIDVLFSQGIEGVIKNKKGEVLPYASIYLMNAKVGTTSNENGVFELKMSKNIQYPRLDTVIVSYIGYETYKKAVYLKNENKKINIILKNTTNQLAEFKVEALTYYPPEQLIRLAIKNTKKNYYRKTTLTNGFYREIIKEEEDWIVLNEAAIQLKYAPYPQKGFIRQAFHAYYKYDYLPWNLSPSTPFVHMHRFTSFIPIQKDQVNVVSSRVSLDHSKHGVASSPVGGPGDLVALDKIKYLYDFFDPKLIKQYNYKLVDEEYHNGEKCYVVDFYPKKSFEKKIYQALNKKMKYPIYLGRIYIAAKTFSVVKFQCQFANSVDFSIYQYNGRVGLGIPDFLKITVDYKKYNNRWMLHTVETEQQKIKTIGSKNKLYTCLRSLKLEEPQEKEISFKRDSIGFITKSMQLRSFYNKYNEQFWNKYEKTNSYLQLSKAVKEDLEKKSSLEKQFLSINLPIDSLQEPIAKQIAYQHLYPIDTLEDKYNWISKKGSDDVLNYLKTENNYYNDVTFKINDSIKGFYYLYNNMFKTKIDTVKGTRSFNINGVKCKYQEDENGSNGLYKIINDSTIHLLIDITQVSKEKNNFWIESVKFNDKEQLAYSYSQGGGIVNTLLVSNSLAEYPQDTIGNISNFIWLNDTSILYTKTSKTARWYQLRVFNTLTSIDSLIYEEEDKTFDIDIIKSTSDQYVFILIESNDEREYYYIGYNNNRIVLNPIVPRLENHKYTIDHKDGDSFYAITNRTKGEYEVVKFPINKPILSNWKTVYSTTKPIEDFYITKDFIAIQEYDKTTLTLKHVNKTTKKVNNVKFKDEIFSFYFNKKTSDTSNVIQLDYESPKTAYITYNIDLEFDSKKVIEQDVFTFDKNAYQVKVISATSNDNVKIPITLFYDESLINDSVRGIILKSYGAYGAKYYPELDVEAKVYVDMGFIVAFAHVRGGGELGDSWYKDGKLLRKKNTFEDYVACAKFLTNKYKIKPKQLTGYGLSAGGLIMGYVANNYPQLFGTLIFDRPYLDVINTMMDSTLALTTMEYKEWGNPNDSLYYEYIKSYSPYQNIKKQDYPNMLFLSGYNDEQTPYWQIAKSVAKYRLNNTAKSLILLNTDLKAGHRGSTNINANTSKITSKFALIQYTLKNR
jgi:protease II